MQLATVISLLLFACAACALQLHPEERGDGFRSSVIPRRSFRRRLASRRIGSSIGPDIVPRDNTHMPPSYILDQLKNLKKEGRITQISVNYGREVTVYRVHSLLSFKGPVVVKEINFSEHRMWQKRDVELEVRGARDANALYAVLQEGETYFILMENLGNKWDQNHRPEGSAALVVMDEADKWYKDVYFVKRNIISTPHDYAWTLLRNNAWQAKMVGQWRHVTLTKHSSHSPIPKDRRYCGIKEWDIDRLPIFSMDDTGAEYYTG